MKNLTITKRFSEIPFAHRQYSHDGHCQWVHGHGWSIDVSFAATKVDENGFIIDFGKLNFLKEWIARHLDHACVFSASDPSIHLFRQLAKDGLLHLFEVADCSAEGLAQLFFAEFNQMVREHTNFRVWVTSITVWEDSKNSATYQE